MDLQPHQQRVVEERKELADKIGKLNTFISGKIFSALCVDEQVSLKAQHGFMCLYLGILDERIGRF